jgi:DNA-binding transcriptional ArsR family regulator
MTAAAPKDFNKTRAAFMQNISGANIPPLAFKLGYLLMYRYANHKTQLCYPSQTTLAADLGVSIRTIQRLLDILERHGLVIAPGDGRGKSSRYWIDPERVTRASPFTSQKGDKKGRHLATKKGDTGVARTNKKRTNIGDRGAKAPPVPLERERSR